MASEILPCHLLRRSGRRGNAHPCIGIDARERLRQGRNGGIILEPLATAGRKHLELAGIDALLVGEKIVRNDIDVPRQQVVDGGRAAPIGDLGHAEIAFEHQELAQEVAGIAFALMSIIDLAGVGLGIGDELGQIAGRQSWSRKHDQGIGRKHADRLHRTGVESGLAENEMRDAVGQLRSAQHGIAVGGRPQHRFGADASTCARGAVLDHNLLAEHHARLLGRKAAQKVGGAAGGKRHHHGDGAIRKRGLRRHRGCRRARKRRRA